MVWGHQPPSKNLLLRIFCGPYRALGPCRPSGDILVTFSGPTGPGGCLGAPGTHWQCPSTCFGQLLGFDLLGGCGRPTQPTEATDVATCQVAGARRRLFSEHKRKEKKRKEKKRKEKKSPPSQALHVPDARSLALCQQESSKGHSHVPPASKVHFFVDTTLWPHQEGFWYTQLQMDP